mgnify:FL=1
MCVGVKQLQNLVIPLQKKRHLTLEVLAGRMCIAFFEEKYGKGFPYDEMRAYSKKDHGRNA